MSDAGTLRAFNPREEKYIPAWPSAEPIPSTEERIYVLGMRVENGKLRFYFVDRPPVPDPSQDEPLQIRIPSDCVIVLRLDPALNWQFRHQNAVTLGPMNYETVLRYFNLVPQIVNGRCLEVRFNALRLNLPEGEANRDPYAMYVQLDQDETEGVSASQLLLRIDPDMSNPGGHN